MKLKNRFIRMATAFAIAGLVAAQIPSRSSVSMAADGYTDGDSGLLNLKGAGAVVAGTVAAGAVYGAITSAGAGSGGGSIVGAVGGSRKPIYDVTQDNDTEFSNIRAIIDTANQSIAYKNEEYTVFWPSNAALEKALGLTKVQSIIGNTERSRKLLASLTVAGKFNIDALKTKAKNKGSLTTLAGHEITLAMDGDSVTANGIKVMQEVPASNGWVLGLNGLIDPDFE